MNNQIKVIGKGKASGKPDTLEVAVDISYVDPSTKNSQRLASDACDRYIKALGEIGIDEKSIETKGFSMQPRFDWIKSQHVFQGYETSNRVRVKTVALEKANQIIDAAVKSGISEIDYVRFSINDREALECLALERAAKNAIARAQAIANGFKAKLGRLLSVDDNVAHSYDYSYKPSYNVFYDASIGDSKTNVAIPEELDYLVEVEAIFEIA